MRRLEEKKAKIQYDQMSVLVEQMLELQWKYQLEGDYREKKKLSETITQLDQRINRKNYGLYGLTEVEIEIVEREIGGK